MTDSALAHFTFRPARLARFIPITGAARRRACATLAHLVLRQRSLFFTANSLTTLLDSAFRALDDRMTLDRDPINRLRSASLQCAALA